MFKITLLPGDGIGPEITEAAKRIMLYTAERNLTTLDLQEELIGGSSYDAHGTPLTEKTLQACKNSDAVFLGAVGGPQWETLDHELKPEAALLKLRKELGLFVNIRPAKVYKAFLNGSSLKPEVLKNTDFVVFRELTGGIYFGEPRGIEKDKAWNTMIYQRHEVERIARAAFEYSLKRDKRVTSVDKANVLEVSQLWRNVVEEVAKDYPDVSLNHMYVDNAAMQIVRNPGQFDIILTSNIFGDILSDISGMITGSLGMLPSASLGEKHALYEPVHGSAPDLAGKDKANPIAAIASVGMMFEHNLNMTKAAEIINKAIENVLSQGYRTEDIAEKGGLIVSTSEMARLIEFNCEEIYNKEGLGVFTL